MILHAGNGTGLLDCFEQFNGQTVEIRAPVEQEEITETRRKIAVISLRVISPSLENGNELPHRFIDPLSSKDLRSHHRELHQTGQSVYAGQGIQEIDKYREEASGWMA